MLDITIIYFSFIHIYTIPWNCQRLTFRCNHHYPEIPEEPPSSTYPAIGHSRVGEQEERTLGNASSQIVVDAYL